MQLENLPNDVLREIVKKMDRDSAINYCKTSKRMQQICAGFWKQWAKEDFNADISQNREYKTDYHNYLAEAVKYYRNWAKKVKIDEKRCAWIFEDPEETCERGAMPGEFFCSSHRRNKEMNIQADKCRKRQNLHRSYIDKADSMSMELAKYLRAKYPKEFNLHVINVDPSLNGVGVISYVERSKISKEIFIHDLIIVMTIDLYEEIEGYILYKTITGTYESVEFRSGNRRLFSQHKLKVPYALTRFAQEMGLTSPAISYLYNAEKFAPNTTLVIE
jgi:hypothetical protein